MEAQVRTLSVAVILALGALALPAAAQESGDEAELARLLEGRTAGEPVRCINARRARDVRVVNRTAIVYRVGDVLFVNRPRSGAEHLDRRYALVNERSSSMLCSSDALLVTDQFSGIQKLVIPGDFVPYSRAGE